MTLPALAAERRCLHAARRPEISIDSCGHRAAGAQQQTYNRISRPTASTLGEKERRANGQRDG